MGNINLYNTYLGKLRKYGLYTSDRFSSAFVDAVNRTYAELNDLVFGSDTLEFIDSFDDIIDKRVTFTDITMSADCDVATGPRTCWTIEWSIDRNYSVNTFKDLITDDFTSTQLVFSITDNVFTVYRAGVVGLSCPLPEQDKFTLKVVSSNDGMAIYADDVALDLTVTTGDATTPHAIGIVASHVISDVLNIQLLRTRFLSSSSLIYDYPLNALTGTGVDELVDLVAGYVATATGEAITTVYVEPSSGLDKRYTAVFDLGLDYHLQDGGEWAIEPESERERKWYMRGIQNARNIMQNTTTYVGMLGAAE